MSSRICICNTQIQIDHIVVLCAVVQQLKVVVSLSTFKSLIVGSTNMIKRMTNNKKNETTCNTHKYCNACTEKHFYEQTLSHLLIKIGSDLLIMMPVLHENEYNQKRLAKRK